MNTHRIISDNNKQPIYKFEGGMRGLSTLFPCLILQNLLCICQKFGEFSETLEKINQFGPNTSGKHYTAKS